MKALWTSESGREFHFSFDRLADRRATARTTNLVEPCSLQTKKKLILSTQQASEQLANLCRPDTAFIWSSILLKTAQQRIVQLTRRFHSQRFSACLPVFPPWYPTGADKRNHQRKYHSPELSGPSSFAASTPSSTYPGGSAPVQRAPHQPYPMLWC